MRLLAADWNRQVRRPRRLKAAHAHGDSGRVARLLTSAGDVAHGGGPTMEERRTGRIFGWLFIGTFVTSIPARLLLIDGAGGRWTHMRFVPEVPSAPVGERRSGLKMVGGPPLTS